MSRAKETSVIKQGTKVRLKRRFNNGIRRSASVKAGKVKSKRQFIRDIN